MVKYMYGEGDNKPDIAEAGEYPATIKTAEEKISKNDNPMIATISYRYFFISKRNTEG